MINQTDKTVLTLSEVVKTYKTSTGGFQALKGINLSIQQGDFLGVIGKSGAGKSTLLNMITGVDHITSGEVIANTNGQPINIHKLDEDSLALWRGLNMGVIYQSFQLLPMLSILENVMLPLDLCGKFRPKDSQEKAYEMLKLVELEEHARKLPIYISGGQQQRVAIARALINDPAILIADEPTGSLDSVTAERIFEVFDKLVASGKTIIMVTHDTSLSPRFSKRTYLADGETITEPAQPPLVLTGKKR